MREYFVRHLNLMTLAPKALFCFGGDRERDSNPRISTLTFGAAYPAGERGFEPTNTWDDLYLFYIRI